MITPTQLRKLGRTHGTPLFIIDHDELRRNYRQFRRYLPRVQVYYAVKANPDPAIVRTAVIVISAGRPSTLAVRHVAKALEPLVIKILGTGD